MRVVVVGAGIAGLTAAWRLREAQHDVEVVAAHSTADTTSAVAAALWYPYRALPEREVTRWAATTFGVLAGLADVPGTGVRLRRGRELFREATPDPWWRDAVPALERLGPDALPDGFGDGLSLTVPVVDMSLHLAWLLAGLADRGVVVRQQLLTRLEEAPSDADVVVNCSGLGARELVGDGRLVPVRGQVVVVEQIGLAEWLLAQSDPEVLTYVVPRERTVVLGGTAQEAAVDLSPDPGTAEAILRRCTALVPELARARVLQHKVGLRPTRPAVRLEAGLLADGRPVVHDYGHGGAGVTLSYGCAQDVVALVEGS